MFLFVDALSVVFCLFLFARFCVGLRVALVFFFTVIAVFFWYVVCFCCLGGVLSMFVSFCVCLCVSCLL